MRNIENIVDNLVDILRKHRLQSSEAILSLVSFAFSGSLGIFLKNKPENFIQLKELTKNNIIDTHLSNAYEIISEYMIGDSLFKQLVNFGKELSEDEWKNIYEHIFQNEYISQLREHIETPMPINKLCMTILSPKHGDFYDGVSGIGSTVVEASNFAKRNNGNISLYTQEINVINHAISVLRIFLLGADCKNIACGDTLRSPAFTDNEDQIKQFDFSVMFPPMGINIKHYDDIVRYDKYHRFKSDFGNGVTADWLFVQHMFASLKQTGKGIIALASGMLFNSSSAKIRKHFLRLGVIESIISLPATALPYTTTPISLLVINRQKKSNDGILFIQTEPLFAKYKSVRWKNQLMLDDNMIEEIADIYNKKTEIDGVSRIATVDYDDVVMLPNRYVTNSLIDTEFGKISIDNAKTENWLKLADIAKFYRGANPTVSLKKDDNGEYKLINYTDVQNGKLLIDNLESYSAKRKINEAKNMVRENDIIISCKGAAIKICVIPPHTEPTLLSMNYIGLRIDSEKYDVQFLNEYLESPVGQNYLKNMQVGTSIVTLAVRDLEKMPVPEIDISKQKEYINTFKKNEEQINVKLEKLHTQLQNEKWSLYMNMGLGKLMTKENSNENDG